MLSVYGYYENGICIPMEKLDLADNQKVIITVMDTRISVSEPSSNKSNRADVLKELTGILPSTITDADVKMCRGAK